MFPTFTFPLAFLALAAVPALVAIYWLRSRHRRQTVSSLMLWLDQRQSKEGGLLFQRLQTPPAFYLELLALLLLIAAAAGPMFRLGDSAPPLVVVLDNSYSMLAGGNDSPRVRAAEAVEQELRHGGYNLVRFVLAGETPQVLGDPAPAGQAAARLSGWKCFAPAANLEEAITFAFALGGGRARVLVVTDHAPPSAPAEGPLQWWAFGRARSNFAVVNASRTSHGGQERCLLEVANLSSEAGRATLTVSESQPSASGPQTTAPDPKPGAESQRSLELGPYETRRVILTLAPDAPALRARLGEDALGLDDGVILLPPRSRPLRVELRFRDDALRSPVEKAVESTGLARLTAERPELILTDRPEDTVGAEVWSVQVIAEPDAESYLGPFVLDRAHPLTAGLSLGGVVWGAGKSEQLGGVPVITAGNVPLLADTAHPGGGHTLRLRLRPDLSTLQNSPNWPVLMWNLIQWRAGQAPGPRESNLRLGAEAVLTVEPGTRAIQLTGPDGDVRQMPAPGGTVTFKPEGVGRYEVSTGQSRYAFVTNALNQEESDLTKAVSGRWGDWVAAAAPQSEYRGIAWVFLLLATAVMVAHLALVARGP